MRKLVVYNMVSIDGYFAGRGGDISWHRVDAEFNQFATETLNSVDTILFGHTTYQLFESFWPKALADRRTSLADRTIAQAIDDATKIVFSKNLKTVKWRNARLEHEINPEIIQQIKSQAGKDIIIYGSGTIVRQLTDLGLIDEYRLIINPVILGAGKTMFESSQPKQCNLVLTHTFANGNLLVTYKI